MNDYVNNVYDALCHVNGKDALSKLDYWNLYHSPEKGHGQHNGEQMSTKMESFFDNTKFMFSCVNTMSILIYHVGLYIIFMHKRYI